MGFFNPDVEDMLEVFQTESLEYMDRMESYLMAEENRGQMSAEALQGIFRIVHTMKSSSAMMGLEDMSRCTHRLEDLFLIYREAPEKAAGEEDQLFDLLYEYVDYVRNEMSRIAQPDYIPLESAGLMEKVSGILARAKEQKDAAEGLLETEPEPVTADKLMEPEVLPAEHAYQWKIYFTENCQMENVRAFLLIKQIQPLCGQLYTTPEDLQAKAAAAQIQKEGLILYFTAADSREVSAKLQASVYVKQVEDLGAAMKREQTRQAGEQAERQGEADSAQRENQSDQKPLNRMGMVVWQKVLQLQNVTGELLTLANRLERTLGETDLVLENRRLISTLENLVSSISLMPVSGMVNQYSRVIRDICRKEDKEIIFQVQGGDLEADKTLIDTLSTPLLHLIRNAADHGIECREERKAAGKNTVGRILFGVNAMGDNLYFSVSDDGRGMDREKILNKAEELGMLTHGREEYTEDEIYRLIFQPGFSTSSQVTEYSGRGVGLDVVQRVADLLRGFVYVESHPGEGTTVTVSVPFSLTSVNCLQFSVNGHICFVPIKNLEQIYAYGDCEDRLVMLEGREYFRDEELMPLIRPEDSSGYQKRQHSQNEDSYIIVARGVKRRVALVTGEIEGQHVIVEKTLPELIPQEYRKRTGMNGCAVTADGEIGFILNIDWLLLACERGDMHGKTASHSAGE